MTDALPPSDSGYVSLPTDLPEALDRLTRFQRLILEILNDLLRAPTESIDTQIDRALARMGAACGSDRTYVFRVRGTDFLDNTHEWVAEGIEPMIHLLQGVPTAMADHWRARLNRDEAIYIPSVLALPEDAPEKQMLLMQGIKSLLVVPLIEAGGLTGFVGYDAVRDHRSFLPSEIFLIRSVANVIGTLLMRRDREREIQRTQKDLQDERNRLKATLDAMPDLMIEIDADGRFVGWHEGWLTSRDIHSAAYIGRLIEEVLTPDAAAVSRRIMAEVDARDVSVGHEYQVQLPHGLRWHSVSAARLPPRDPQERPGYLVVVRDTTEAHAQRQQVQRLGMFAQLTTNLVIVTDARQRIEWVNAAFEGQTGYSLHEATGKPLCAVLHCQDTGDNSRHRLREMLAAGQPGQAELLACSRQGRTFWIDLSIQPLAGDDGTITGYMAVASDISAHKLQEAQLAATASDALAARRQLAAAVDALPDAFAYYDANDRLVICNARYREYYPKTAPAMVPGASFEEILRYGLQHGEVTEALGRGEEWAAERLARHRMGHNEQEQLLADGRWLRVLERSTPDGGRVGLWVDITALKLSEQRARADLTSAMDASRDGIAITDPEGNYVYMNAAHMEMFGISSPAEIIGKSWRTLYTPDMADQIQRTAFTALSTEGGWQGEVMGRRLDGTELPQEVSLTLKNDGRLICISRDISKRLREQQERTRLREELQMAQRREVISQLAAGLAHDLNNLLAAIGGSAVLIDGSAPANVSSHTRRILAATEQANALVRRFLTLGQRQSNRSRIDLRAPLREGVDLVRASLCNQTRLVLSLPDAPVEIEADPTDILQVVLNLVINARDAIAAAPPRDGGYEIEIALSAAGPGQTTGPFAAGSIDPGGRYVCMTVTDTGPGIPPETLAKVFQPYFSTKGSSGTGLGLAIVSGVITANGGAVALDSAPGRGTRFTLLWPTEATPRPESPPPEQAIPAGKAPFDASPAGKAGQLAGRFILVVDDNADVLKVLTAFLEQAGAEVVPCADPRDALDAVRDDPDLWDLMVTDYDMPHLTGADLTQAAQQEVPDLPVLLVTALPDWRSKVGPSTPRFAGVLGKPLSRSDLIAAAEAAIAASAAR